MNMSSALIWHLIRDNNSFLIKRQRTNRLGAVQFSSEPGNLLNVNSYKYSGIANEKTVDITDDLKLITKTPLSNKPLTSTTSEELNLDASESLAKLQKITLSGSYRADLIAPAKLRLAKKQRDVSIRTGLNKKVVKSTRRSKRL